MHVTAIVVAGGSGSRLGASVPKQFLEIDGRTILERSLAAFLGHERISEVVVALPPGVPLPAALAHPKLRAVAGGRRRQDSVAHAFDAVAPESDVVLVHDAARPFVSAAVISRAIDAAADHGAAIVAMPVTDTVKQVSMEAGDRVIVGTIPRESLYLAQTPQAFRRDILATAVALGRDGAHATDEAALAELAGIPVRIVDGEAANMKITTAEDLDRARGGMAVTTRAGIGYDLHRLVEGRPLIIGGVDIPFERGAQGHSDADVACHSATDAILGAACLGDIGRHFPDTDPRWKGASSIDLLRQAAALVRDAGYRVVNLDVVIVLERPKIAPHLAAIRQGLADAVSVPVEAVSVKGKTNEGVDAVGRGEAIAAHAVALVEKSRL